MLRGYAYLHILAVVAIGAGLITGSALVGVAVLIVGYIVYALR